VVKNDSLRRDAMHLVSTGMHTFDQKMHETFIDNRIAGLIKLIYDPGLVWTFKISGP
jgi:hypothetical protein